jgi:hypothetical protein
MGKLFPSSTGRDINIILLLTHNFNLYLRMARKTKPIAKKAKPEQEPQDSGDLQDEGEVFS